ncbi:glycosyltransferase family 4 protein [Pseudomonas knackmussii]|uniref:glycosyltransferase family 4 protein n=1 Tax=Pseudomonas knackmussii TaxID=65741 RepID=UPI003BE61B19
MRILIISPDFPYPPNHGGRSDIFSRIKSLSKLYGRANIDLISTVTEIPAKQDQEEIAKYTNTSLVCPRSTSPLNLLWTTPHQIKSREKLKTIDLPGNDYDITILEGDYVAAILDNKSINFGRKILRVHNDEPLYFRKLAKSTGNWRKLYYYFESIKFRTASKHLGTLVDRKLYISKDEILSTDSNSEWLPPTVENDSILPPFKKNESGKVLFVGSLFMPNNIFGLRWYLENVHKKLIKTHDNYQLTIVGNSKDSKNEWINGYTHINFLGSLSDQELIDVYKESNLFVAPIFHGTGVKIKVINAITHGLPVVTTKTGNEGTGLVPGREILISDTADDFFNTISDALGSQEKLLNIALNAQTSLIRNFSEDRLYNIIQNISKKQQTHR